MGNLIIGGATNYTWNELQYWVNSIRKTGFAGDVALVASNITKETIEKLTSEGVILYLYGEQQEDGSFLDKSNMAPHVSRFFFIWDFLRRKNYANVIVTDTRDVVFQYDPTEFIEAELEMFDFITSCEGLIYANEPWGKKNLTETFGEFFGELYEEKGIFNVGVLAGKSYAIESLLLSIFQMSLNRPIKIVDQAVYNFLLNQSFISDTTYRTDADDIWAIQLGTTIEAIKAGSGDIGQEYLRNPASLDEYQKNFIGKQPKIDGDLVTNAFDEPYLIVHQYDRIPGLKEKIQEKYRSV